MVSKAEVLKSLGYKVYAIIKKLGRADEEAVLSLQK